MSTKTQAKPIFAATLTPHRSLSSIGKRWVIGLVSAMALVPGVLFYVAGAWPVLGFMVLDVLAIWAAMALSMRSGKLQEVLTLWPGTLELKKIDAKGHEEIMSFVPQTVRFVIDRDYEERVNGLWLKEQNRRVALGAFLSAEDKQSFSKVFGTALRKARG